jgi:hypothetical protein
VKKKAYHTTKQAKKTIVKAKYNPLLKQSCDRIKTKILTQRTKTTLTNHKNVILISTLNTYEIHKEKKQTCPLLKSEEYA